jgi:PAS domain S-box-containing protein
LSWEPLAALLAERSDTPIVVLDEQGTIRLFNSGMEKITGWLRHEVIGHPWLEAGPFAGHQESARFWLRDVLRGAARTGQLEMRTRAGSSLVLDLDAALTSEAAGKLVLAVVKASHWISTPAGDMTYEIEGEDQSFGRLRRIVSLGAVREFDAQRFCYEVIHRRPEPCPGCPARCEPASLPRTVVRSTGADDGTFEVVTAKRASPTAVQVDVRPFSHEQLTDLIRARVADLARRSRLSERERTVLDYLLLGRSLKDIATVLHVSVHTVRFHQDNLLRKLGADSRADLLRLIL